MIKKLVLISSLVILINDLFAQSVTLPFEKIQRIEQERNLLLQDQQWHPIYPLTTNSLNQTIFPDIQQNSPSKERGFVNWLNRKLFHESLINLDTAGLKLTIDPLVSFEIGRMIDEKQNTWVNTRGIKADGMIGKKVFFHTAFYESQAVFPKWTDIQANTLMVVPGQAMFKRFKETGFDYAFAEGHVTYSPSKYFDLKLGHGKNFIGDGYRSVFLSDAAFNYPYFIINTKVWNIEYVNIFSQLMDISQPKGSWDPWPKKYTTTHYLSWNITKWLNIGLFESIVWDAGDSTGKRGFELQYLNPVIFYRPVEFSLGSPDNALLGGSIRFRILKSNFIYFQLLLDEFKLEHVLKGDGWWANKHGFQWGIKSFDPFGIKNLYIQAEYNHVRPYTYAHSTTLQNYGHYNQPLAHPQGANFREVILILEQRIKRWQMSYQLVRSTYGEDSTGTNFGHNIFFPYKTYVTEYGNKIGQGIKTKLFYHELKLGYIVNPATNLSLTAGLTIFNRKSDIAEIKDLHFWIGLRSAMFNRYYDF